MLVGVSERPRLLLVPAAAALYSAAAAAAAPGVVCPINGMAQCISSTTRC